MTDPSTLTAAIDNASKVANTPLFTTIIDRITGFKISEWIAEGDVRKKMIIEQYEEAKKNGLQGVSYVKNLRDTTNLIETAVESSKYIDSKKENEIKFDNDFFWNTLEYAKSISNNEVQKLIAKIIADEYNKPETYSLNTLQVLKTLGKKELELFQKICCLCVLDGIIPTEVFSNTEENFMTKLNIDYADFNTLQSIGLFLPNDMTRNYKNDNNHDFKLTYFDKEIIFKPLSKNIPIQLQNFYCLSNTGMQIMSHLNPYYIEEYFEWLKTNYEVRGYSKNAANKA